MKYANKIVFKCLVNSSLRGLLLLFCMVPNPFAAFPLKSPDIHGCNFVSAWRYPASTTVTWTLFPNVLWLYPALHSAAPWYAGDALRKRNWKHFMSHGAVSDPVRHSKSIRRITEDQWPLFTRKPRPHLGDATPRQLFLAVGYIFFAIDVWFCAKLAF